MKISNFTQGELDMFRQECNFVDPEDKCFELKARGCTDVQLSVKLNISESMVAVHMRRVRAKITYVLEEHAKQAEQLRQSTNGCGNCPSKVYHTMKEWAEIPDFISVKGTEYIYGDYRTVIIRGKEVNIPRVKWGDGVTPLSEIPFGTSSITDEDMDNWDNASDFNSIVTIDKKYAESNFIFPVDGYLTLKFETQWDYAEVKVLGASGQLFFTFEKPRQIDIRSKEIFVKKNMQCRYINSSEGAKIEFHPIV